MTGNEQHRPGSRERSSRSAFMTVTVLATTDMHGLVYPTTTSRRKPAARGLAAAATLIGEVRRENPNTLLLDCGDTIQGSSLTSVYQAARRAGRTRAPEPMMLAMSRIGYDAMVVGNHEFNLRPREPRRRPRERELPVAVGQHPLDRRRAAAVRALPVEDGGGRQGRRHRHHDAPRSRSGRSRRTSRGLSLARAGRGRASRAPAARGREAGRDPRRGARRPRARRRDGGGAPERAAGREPRLGARRALPAARGRRSTATATSASRAGASAACSLVQPRAWAMDVARVDLTLERDPRSGRLPARGRDEPPAAGHARDAGRPSGSSSSPGRTTRPPSATSTRPVAEARVRARGARGRFEDSALVDAIHEVQLHYAEARR